MSIFRFNLFIYSCKYRLIKLVFIFQNIIHDCHYFVSYRAMDLLSKSFQSLESFCNVYVTFDNSFCE